MEYLRQVFVLDDKFKTEVQRLNGLKQHFSDDADSVIFTGFFEADFERFADQLIDLITPGVLWLLDFDFGRDVTGLDLLRAIHKKSDEKKVVLPRIALYSGFDGARGHPELPQLGVTDYIYKTYSDKEIAKRLACILGLQCTLPKRRRISESERASILTNLRQTIITRSGAMDSVFDQGIMPALTNEDPVLILGETGTGKELVAQAVHDHGMRRDSGELTTLNVASADPNLARGDFFGHLPGAFTDASACRKGIFDRANQGDLFLDEIGELPHDIQAALLRAIEYRRYSALGSEGEAEIDIRFISATNRSTDELLSSGKFRRDFFERISQNIITLPPLRHRKEDIPILFDHFTALHFGEDLPFSFESLSSDHRDRLQGWHWPGNVRELSSVVRRMGNLVYAGIELSSLDL
jgi:DNA-binding NtrC family response regulator